MTAYADMTPTRLTNCSSKGCTSKMFFSIPGASMGKHGYTSRGFHFKASHLNLGEEENNQQ